MTPLPRQIGEKRVEGRGTSKFAALFGQDSGFPDQIEGSADPISAERWLGWGCSHPSGLPSPPSLPSPWLPFGSPPEEKKSQSQAHDLQWHGRGSEGRRFTLLVCLVPLRPESGGRSSLATNAMLCAQETSSNHQRFGKHNEKDGVLRKGSGIKIVVKNKKRGYSRKSAKMHLLG